MTIPMIVFNISSHEQAEQADKADDKIFKIIVTEDYNVEEDAGEIQPSEEINPVPEETEYEKLDKLIERSTGTISSCRGDDKIRYRPTSGRVQSRCQGSLYQGHQKTYKCGIHQVGVPVN